eukprot:6419915-Prymnesium_polylepis.1
MFTEDANVPKGGGRWFECGSSGSAEAPEACVRAIAVVDGVARHEGWHVVPTGDEVDGGLWRGEPLGVRVRVGERVGARRRNGPSSDCSSSYSSHQATAHQTTHPIKRLLIKLLAPSSEYQACGVMSHGEP